MPTPTLSNAPLDEALAEARETYAAARPNSAAAHQAACAHMPGGNTRTVLYHGPFPLRADRGEGAYLDDVDGHRYLNLLGEYTAGVFGHSHPAIVAALREAIGDGLNLGAHNRHEVRLAELVCARFPAIERVRFTNSGTEANLMAVSTARHVTGRSKVLVMSGGYHGGLLYFGGGGIPINAPFPYLLGTYNDIEATRTLIRENADDLACVLTEPMMGSGGCLSADPAFLAMLREETMAAGALLIFDEVMTSRFGGHGAHALLGIAPDLITLGKWVGGGMSFGAFGGRADIMALYDPTAAGAMPHAGTFNNNVLSMRAGIAALTEAFTPEQAVALHARGEALRDRLDSLFEGRDVALSVTGQGSLMNLHGASGPFHKVADLAASDDRVKELIFLDLLERGFYIARRGFIALSTAVTAPELDGFAEALDDIVAARRSVLPARAAVAAA
ncbi:MAG: aminotransferase class III-fold pyridoxal phosphate-dependent enzyme [Alphaproteobacteria bacterium]|nr:aminotransferase class III-fold pyridoxal phosphate-dependent enzyme [Alphaproteobacteria bacterium]